MPLRRFLGWVIVCLSALSLVFPAAALARVPGTTSAEPRMVVSLDECLAMAIAQNEKLRGAGYEIEAAKGQLIEADARGMPVLEYEIQVAPVPTDVNVALQSFAEGNITVWGKLRLVLGIPLYAFGALTEAKKLAESGVVAARHNVVKTREQLIYDIKQLYYGILFGKEMRALLTKSIDGLTKKIENEEASDEPTLSPFEILEMKVFREELTAQLDRTNVETELAYQGLKVQMGLPIEVAIELDRSILDPEVVELGPLESYVNASMEHTPDSKLIEVGVEAKRKLWKIEKLKLAPQVGVGFFLEAARAAGDIRGITTTDDYNNPFDYTRAGIGLRIQGKIDFHGAYGRIKKARAEYLKSLYEGQIGKKALNLDARKAYDEVVKMKKKVFNTKKSMSMSNQMVFLSKTNYEMGLAEVNDYRRALELSLATRSHYYRSVFDFNVALARLEQKVGEEAFAELTGRPKISAYEAFDVSADLKDISMEEDNEKTYEGDETTVDVPTSESDIAPSDIN